MEITTRLVFAPKVPAEQKEKFKKILYGNDKSFLTKITTTKLEVMPDKKYITKIIGLKNLKIIFKPIGKIANPLIFMATLSFKTEKGESELFVWRIIEDSNLDFDKIQGFELEMKFSRIEFEELELFQDKLEYIKNSENFEFNINQFDEFIEIFDFYKKIANELNNDTNFPISNHQFNSYYFVPVDEKTIDLTFANEICNEEGIILGYKFSKRDFQNLDDKEQEKCIEVFEFEILGNETDLKKIKVFGANDSLYISSQAKILNSDSNLIHFELYNSAMKSRIIQKSIKQKDKTESINEKYIILTGSIKNSNFQDLKTIQSQKNKVIWYLNLWDLGQKIKIETIESSIKEILKGTTSNGIELFEYIIGIKPLPNIVYWEFRNLNQSKFLNSLDQSQKDAFLMATDGNPVSLIKGPPGTGKTHVIEAIINYLVRERKEKVLVSSQTHIAIDNVLDKLINRSDMIIPRRISNRNNKYDIEHIDKTLFNIWNTNIKQFLAKTSNQELSNKILTNLKTFKGEKNFSYTGEDFKPQVIGVTTTASQTSGKKGYEVLKGFDWLIIDEISKCPITEVLRYLPYVKRVIMVGDDYQLAPLLEFTKNDVKNFESYDEDKFDQLKKIYEESVFASLYDKALKEGRLVQLNNNYRSVKDILTIYNVFYSHQLQNKRKEIIYKKILFKNEDSRLNKSDALFIEVKNGSEMKEGSSRYNIQELEATKFYLNKILNEVKNPEEVTIAAIFPYAAQINRFYRQNNNLINKVREVFKSFELNTVDAFQGKEADIVLVNTVVTDSSKRNFLSDFRRINVALSRARDKILIFGNYRTLEKINMKINDKPAKCYFKNIIEYISDRNEGIGFIEFNGGNYNEIYE